MQDAHLDGLERKVKDNALKKYHFGGKSDFIKLLRCYFEKKKI